MKEITQIRKLSLWIFFVPFIAINLCLLISINYSFLENTFFIVDEIGRSKFSIPYIDGSLSISRASRTFPQFLIFKPAMVLTGVLLVLYWKNNNKLINNFSNLKNKNFYFKFFGILSAIFLIIHSIFLGIEFDILLIKLLRRVILLGFILCEIIAQGLLVYSLFKIQNNIASYSNKKILNLKLVLVGLMFVVALICAPILSNEDYTHLKHGLEWNYFLGIILFYFLTNLFWKRTT